MEFAAYSANVILEEEATKLTPMERGALSIVFTLLFIAALIGNALSIKRNIKRRLRLFYKCCVVSLAFSDLLLVASTYIYSISMFSHALADWELGELMCRIIPYTQTMAVLANSFTLCLIAMDRYNGIVRVSPHLWEPDLKKCLTFGLFLWNTANVTALPMLFQYEIVTLDVINLDTTQNKVTFREQMDFCAWKSREKMRKYVALLFVLIFIPLMITFLILYCIISCFLWTRQSYSARNPRRDALPLRQMTHAEPTRETPQPLWIEVVLADPSESSSSVSPTVANHWGWPGMSVDCPAQNRKLTFRRIMHQLNPIPLQSIPENQNVTDPVPEEPPQVVVPPIPPVPPRGVSVAERQKKRIVIIIFSLMLSFVLTRLPIWIFNLLHTTKGPVGKHWWLMQYILSAISLLGTVLNPYLYGFLQEKPRKKIDFSPCNWIQQVRRLVSVNSDS